MGLLGWIKLLNVKKQIKVTIFPFCFAFFILLAKIISIFHFTLSEIIIRENFIENCKNGSWKIPVCLLLNLFPITIWVKCKPFCFQRIFYTKSKTVESIRRIISVMQINVKFCYTIDFNNINLFHQNCSSNKYRIKRNILTFLLKLSFGNW